MLSHVRRPVFVAVATLLLAVILQVPATSLANNGGPVAGLPLYADVTQAAGLGGYLHAGYLGPEGGLSDAYFPDIMGPGACWLDADGDGDLDVFIPNNRYMSQPERNQRDPRAALYINDGGRFTDMAATAGADLAGHYMGCSAADYDNDGDTDLYVTGYGGNTLLENDAGAFSDVTHVAGVRDAMCGEFACWSSSANWFDADADGCLDLFVGHFGDFDPNNPPGTNGPEYAPGQANSFFYGHCDGTFTEATQAAGLDAERSNTWASVAADLDGDGDLDLYVANDGDANDLYEGNGDGTFTRRARSAANDVRHGMGAATADYDGDGRLDLAVTNFVGELNGIYRAVAADYVDEGATGDLEAARDWSGWAVHFLDANNDARPDLMVVNGMTERIPEFHLEEPLQLFFNDGGTFRQASHLLGEAFQQPLVGRGAAWADYDDDGDMDVLVGQAGENPVKLLQAQRTPGNFLTISLVGGSGMNLDAIGATVTVTSPGNPDQKQVRTAGSGFLSSNDPRLHFGLGAARTADVTVTWPDGSQQGWLDVPANRFVRLTAGEPEPQVLAARPFVQVSGPALAQRLSPAEFTAHLEAPDGAEIQSVSWDFGEATAAGSTATHRFTDVGQQVVYATITDTTGRQTTAAFAVTAWDDIHAHVDMVAGLFLPHENPRGVVHVAFSNGDPVSGAHVGLEARPQAIDPAAGDAAEALPYFMQELAGRVPLQVSGTTGADGTFRFVLPHTFKLQTGAGTLAFTHPGEYRVLADGSVRGQAVLAGASEYSVLLPPLAS